jgi:threonine dehydrogenase-like Zn-dependent dehydrogenase
MRASVFHGKGDIRIEEVPDPSIQQPTDAVVRITHAAICGSDLWFYRGVWDWKPGYRTGHEFVGVVDAVGDEVGTVKPGDRCPSDGVRCRCTTRLPTRACSAPTR